DMATKLATARSWLAHVGSLVDAGAADFDVEASILKLAASDAAMAITTQAVQLQGGYGYMTGSKVERLFRDAKLTQIWEGANELHRARSAGRFPPPDPASRPPARPSAPPPGPGGLA